MALLIDGYNLLHATDIFGPPGAGTALHRSRMALLEFLAGALTSRQRKQAVIVFDAAGAPPGLPQTLAHAQITIQFAREFADADAMLELLIDECPAPSSLLVVSGDHRVQRAARRRGAKYVDSGVWFAELRAQSRRTPASERLSSAKPSIDASPDQVAYWLEKFSEPLPPKEERPVKRRLKSPPTPPPSTPPQSPAGEKRKRAPRKSKPRGATEKPIFGEGIFPPGYGDDLLDGADKL